MVMETGQQGRRECSAVWGKRLDDGKWMSSGIPNL